MDEMIKIATKEDLKICIPIAEGNFVLEEQAVLNLNKKVSKEIEKDLLNTLNFTIEEINIDLDDELVEKYGIMIPVIELDGEELQYGIINKMFISEAFSRKNLEFIS